jgi:hypothetical protein
MIAITEPMIYLVPRHLLPACVSGLGEDRKVLLINHPVIIDIAWYVSVYFGGRLDFAGHD